MSEALDTWFPYLKARMDLIRECLRKGKTEEEIYGLLDIHPQQYAGLVHYARKLEAGYTDTVFG